MPASRPLLAALALALALPAHLPAQRERELPRKEISDPTAAGFARLQPLVDAQNYPAALTLVEQLLSAASPTSYDAYLLSQLQAQLHFTQNRLAAAIPALERAHALAEANPNFFELPAHLERLNLLAQLHYQVAAEAQGTEAQRAGYLTALSWLDRLLARSPRPSPETRAFAASLHYTLATLEPTPDPARLRQALGQIEEAFLLSARPSNQLRLLLVATLLQLGDHGRAAEHLELLAAQDPDNASTWSQLQSLYLAKAAETPDPAQARASHLRALHTLDRAQARGHLASPRDHYTRVAILFNLGQFTRAAELLEKGLAAGTLENSKRNWELLASAYQQSEQLERAADAMARAVKQFPQDGPLEFTLAQFLHAQGQADEAYTRGRAALAKPGHERLGQAKLYLAFLAFELQRYEEAEQWITQARAAGDASAASLDPLARAITDALAARRG